MIRKSLIALAAIGAALLSGCATYPYDTYAYNDGYYYDQPAPRYYSTPAPSYYYPAPRYYGPPVVYGPPVALSFGYSYHKHR